MKERPILFSGAMVRALLDGRKTQTRRVVKTIPGEPDCIKDADGLPSRLPGPRNWECCPYGVPGDRLWVREAWAKVPASAYRMSEGVQQTVNPSDPDDAAIYAAGWDRSIPKWKPSIHMPRWASRIALQITDVRVERLQDISEADALAEGIDRIRYPEVGEWGWPQARYRQLWEHINGAGSWDANPWVWAVSFKAVQP